MRPTGRISIPKLSKGFDEARTRARWDVPYVPGDAVVSPGSGKVPTTPWSAKELTKTAKTQATRFELIEQQQM